MEVIMTSKVIVKEVGKFEKIRFNTYLQLKKFNAKLLERLEEQGMDQFSFPFVLAERSKWR